MGDFTVIESWSSVGHLFHSIYPNISFSLGILTLLMHKTPSTTLLITFLVLFPLFFFAYLLLFCLRVLMSLAVFDKYFVF